MSFDNSQSARVPPWQGRIRRRAHRRYVLLELTETGLSKTFTSVIRKVREVLDERG